MRVDDFYFKAGDKVVKVSRGRFPHYLAGIATPPKLPQYGEVYCVEDFWEGPEFNVIMLLGSAGGATTAMADQLDGKPTPFAELMKSSCAWLLLNASPKPPRRSLRRWLVELLWS